MLLPLVGAARAAREVGVGDHLCQGDGACKRPCKCKNIHFRPPLQHFLACFSYIASAKDSCFTSLHTAHPSFCTNFACTDDATTPCIDIGHVYGILTYPWTVRDFADLGMAFLT